MASSTESLGAQALGDSRGRSQLHLSFCTCRGACLLALQPCWRPLPSGGPLCFPPLAGPGALSAAWSQIPGLGLSTDKEEKAGRRLLGLQLGVSTSTCEALAA